MNRIFCKLCLAEDPKHAGFTSEPFESMSAEAVVEKLGRLDKHIAAHHPELALQSVKVGTEMSRFIRLCAFDFEEPFAIASRDKLRYDLAKLTRAYKLSDEKIKEKVGALRMPYGTEGDTWANSPHFFSALRQDVITLIVSIRDQLEETGKYSQDEPVEPPLIVTP